MTYLERVWIRKDNCVFLIKPRYKSEDKSEGELLKLIEALFEYFSGSTTLFILYDVITDKSLNKCRNPLPLVLNSVVQKYST